MNLSLTTIFFKGTSLKSKRIHLESPRRRGKIDIVSHLADLIHRVVGRGVDLQNVEIGGRRERLAHLAFAAGRAVFGTETVDRTGKDLRHRCLAGATGAREEIGVTDVARTDLVDKRPYDMILTDDVTEGVGTVSAIKRSVSHRAII